MLPAWNMKVGSGSCQAKGALDIFGRYDSLRLRTYRDGESLHSRIRLQSLGTSSLLRFDDVRYFNRVYARDGSIAGRLAEVEQFYAGCPFPCELITSDGEAAAKCSRVASSRGWTRGKHYTWLAAPAEQLEVPPASNHFVVRRVHPGEEERFLATYLSAFEAKREHFPAAIRNMRHLFLHRSLTFLLATCEGLPAGVGMTYSDGDAMAFCAGATIPEFRNQGCHHAMLAARVKLARKSNCSYVYGWAAAEGQSKRNMMQIGMEIAGATSAWLCPHT
jgi:hypothetical protein